MEKHFDKDWCRQTFQVLIFLNELYDQIESQNSLEARGPDWGDDPFSDEIPAASISFEAKVKRGNKRGSDLWIGIWFSEEAPVMGRPIWVIVHKKDPKLWSRIQDEFKDGLVNMDYEGIGLQWPLLNESTIDQVRDSAKDLAARIIRVLLPN